MKKIIKNSLCLCLAMFLMFSVVSCGKDQENPEKQQEINNREEVETSEEITENPKATYVDGILVVNKKNSIPAGFAQGPDPKAKEEINRLIKDMQNLGYDISSGYSGFRSHEYQTNLYNRYVDNHGKEEADTYSARPGYSEHETGLSFDLLNGNEELMREKKAAKWVAENAHKYGFIVRYPEGKEDITGFMYEPWHLRYVGEIAEDIYQQQITLEEYLNVEGGDYNK